MFSMSAAHVQPLAWDSEFFGLPIARTTASGLRPVDLEQAVRACAEAGIRCLYCELDPSDPAATARAQALGFRLIELRLRFHHDLRQPADATPLAFAEPVLAVDTCVQPEDIAGLEDIALSIAPQSRFAVDQRFGDEASRRLYLRWLHSSLQAGTMTFLLARLAGRVAGFATLKAAAQFLHLELIGVDPAARGQGVGARLLQAAVDAATAAGAAGIEVVTQGRNVPAIRLYERAGFRLAYATYYFHKWFDERDDE